STKVIQLKNANGCAAGLPQTQSQRRTFNLKLPALVQIHSSCVFKFFDPNDLREGELHQPTD
ncbi:Hypothetical predicted protein, partial [Paramuricea clavata]